MQEINRTEIATLGEFGLIKHLTKDIEIKNPETQYGVGDDAAAVSYTHLDVYKRQELSYTPDRVSRKLVEEAARSTQ